MDIIKTYSLNILCKYHYSIYWEGHGDPYILKASLLIVFIRTGSGSFFDQFYELYIKLIIIVILIHYSNGI